MKRNYYLYTVMRRENKLKNLVIGFFRDLSSTFRLFIEVFTRTDFGHRYFIYWGAMFWGVGGLLLPILITGGIGAFMGELDFGKFFSYGFTWIVYFILFIRQCNKHRKDIKKRDISFYENRYSHYDGHIRSFVYEIRDRLFKKNADSRIVETVCEPLPFFASGLLLMLLQQPIGLLLFICSIFYALSYLGAYYQSDEYFWERNDVGIYNELLEDVFVNEADHSKDQGVKYFGYRPSDKKVRERVFRMMVSGDEDHADRSRYEGYEEEAPEVS